MIGRRRHQQEEAAREAERRALFEELAKRPDTVCPFLGLAEARSEYHDGVTDQHRCYAFGDPAELSAEQQQRVCLQRGYGNCPRYLRGVLVIPTEELEALRHPQAPLPRPAPTPAPAGRGGGGRRTLVVVAFVLLLAAAGGLGAFALLDRDGGIAQQTPTAGVTASDRESVAPSATAGPATPSPLPETPPPEATPQPGDVFDHYEVSVPGGENLVFDVNDAGEVVGELPTSFPDWSFAAVELVEAPSGLRYWRTTDGDLTGWSYIRGRSGTFYIRAVYLASDGTRRSELLPPDQL